MTHSLRAAIEVFQGPPGSLPDGLTGAARVLRMGMPLSLRAFVERATAFEVIDVLDPPLRIATQNLGLFPAAAIEFPLPDSITAPTGVEAVGLIRMYKGAERGKALPSLESWLRAEQPDVIVLTEFWVKDEKAQFADTLRDLYPHSLMGPDEDAPRPIELEVFDGGLLVLSRHPIMQWRQTIFRQCSGEDCFVNKGVLHLRIAHPAFPDGVDIFGSHMQSCPPEYGEGWIDAGPGDCHEKLHTHQALHQRDFVHAYTDPSRPAFLLGDLNHDGNDPAEFGGLVSFLEAPQDLWLAAGTGTGITSDAKGSFQEDRSPRPPDDPERLKDGSRLDFVLSWPSAAAQAPIEVLPASADLIRLQTSPGRDLSDHYGVLASVGAVGRTAIDRNQPIQSVRLFARGLRCLRETAGPAPLVSEIAGSDEIVTTLTFSRASDGASKEIETTFDGMDTGNWKYFSEQLVIDGWPDPGNHIDVSAHLYEDDPTPVGVSTGASNLGDRHIRLSRDELLLYRGRGQVPRTLPLFHGDGGEYALTIAVEVT